MISQRVIAPASKVSMGRRFAEATLSASSALEEVRDELLEAMGWRLPRQEWIEKMAPLV